MRLPVISTESQPSGVELRPAGDGIEYQSDSASPSRHAPEPPRLPNADAATPGPPARASEEDARLRTTALIEARLTQIAAEMGSLEVAYRVFAQACQSPESDDANTSNWLAGLKRGPNSAAVSETPPAHRRASFDCAGSWQDLKIRVNALKATLDQAAELARQNGMPPDNWRERLDSHRLIDLQSY
ncbi:MAG: hypothetical protein JXO72_02110 [Vicinamibacteria bacterium]|nr:hypothetical protein [Vicinamibacteria bacterium]